MIKINNKLLKCLVAFALVLLLNACGSGQQGKDSHPSQRAPGVVASISVQKNSSDQAEISWQGQVNAKAYQLQISSSEDFSPITTVKTYRLREPCFLLTDLILGETYYAKIISIGDSKQSPPSDAFDFAVPPKPPTSVVANIDNTTGEITLQWQGEAKDYRVYWSTSAEISVDNYNSVTNVLGGKTLTYAIASMGLTSGGKLYYLVVASTNGVESLTSTTSQTSISITVTDFSSKVISVLPSNNTLGVDTALEKINVTFNKDIAVESLNSDTFEVFRPDNSKVSGTVSYNQSGKTASFIPNNLWASNTIYTIKLSTDITGVDGLSLTKEFTSSFTTFLPTLTIGDVSVNEAAGTATVMVTLSEASGAATILTYRTVNGSAIAPSDFVAISNGGLILAAGDVNATVTITLQNDATLEANEQFTLEIVTMVGATANKEKGTVTIENDDAPTSPELSLTNGDGQVILTWPDVLGASSYNVYFSRQNDVTPGNYAASGGTLLSSQLSGLVFTHFIQSTNPNGLKFDVNYYFTVTALTENLESPPSPEKVTKLKITPTQPLNDTGIAFGGGSTTNNTDCIGIVIDQQDCSAGRDVTNNDDTDGHAGFSYTKLDSDGNVTTGAWNCVRDNVTGLIWEVKTTDGLLRDKNHSYTWYNTTGINDGGALGTANAGTCFDTSNCDTEKFVAQVNFAGLCGASDDWRMPTIVELGSLVNINVYGHAIDENYFPNSSGEYYWTSSPSGRSPNSAWNVNFYGGAFGTNGRDEPDRRVRLVRSGL